MPHRSSELDKNRLLFFGPKETKASFQYISDEKKEMLQRNSSGSKRRMKSLEK